MIGAIVWVEHAGPEVKHRRHAGFGSRLVKAVLDGYGGVRLDLNNTGLACFMAGCFGGSPPGRRAEPDNNPRWGANPPPFHGETQKVRGNPRAIPTLTPHTPNPHRTR